MIVCLVAVIFIVLKALEHGADDSEINLSRFARPPTQPQLDFIDDLFEEREVEPWMYKVIPETVEEASNLIEVLLDQPYRDDDDEDWD